jgi:hypothetical protein
MSEKKSYVRKNLMSKNNNFLIIWKKLKIEKNKFNILKFFDFKNDGQKSILF